MTTYTLQKKCEICGAHLPDDFTNLLCLDHYNILVQEQEAKRAQIIEEVKKAPESPIHPDNVVEATPVVEEGKTAPEGHTTPNFGILDPNYKENPEMEDKDQILANLAQFIYTHDPQKKKKGKLLWYPTRNIYTFIKNYCMRKVLSHPQYPKYIWKPKIVDVGCGSGAGSNVLSLEADFVWGIDKNEFSIEFAKEAFTREKNGIYYSSQITFDQIDILTDTRLFMQFDVVVAIEVIEHIYDTDAFLKAIIRFAKRDKRGNVHIDGATEFFISSPNRNNPKIRKDQPENPYHVREWTSQELKGLLLNYFEMVEFMNQKGELIPDDTIEQVILAKCTYPK